MAHIRQRKEFLLHEIGRMQEIIRERDRQIVALEKRFLVAVEAKDKPLQKEAVIDEAPSKSKKRRA